MTDRTAWISLRWKNSLNPPASPFYNQPTSKGDVTCTFSYSAVGGTNEQWLIDIEKQGNNHYCTIRR